MNTSHNTHSQFIFISSPPIPSSYSQSKCNVLSGKKDFGASYFFFFFFLFSCLNIQRHPDNGSHPWRSVGLLSFHVQVFEATYLSTYALPHIIFIFLWPQIHSMLLKTKKRKAHTQKLTGQSTAALYSLQSDKDLRGFARHPDRKRFSLPPHDCLPLSK